MAKRSAGVLAYRRGTGGVEILLVHPGGPFWANKDDGAWSIPKGEWEEGEDPLAVSRREFAEELGDAAARALQDLPDTAFVPLGAIRQKGGKVVTAFAVELDIDVSAIRSNEVEIEWPPRSGRQRTVPEVDRAMWFATEAARGKINAAQAELVDRLLVLCDQVRPSSTDQPADRSGR